MSWVIDASVAVKWYVPEELHEEAYSLLGGATPLVAPDWIIQEVSHALFRKWRNDEIAMDQARAIIALLLSSLAELYCSTTLTERALEIAFELNHPVHDCLYLACAEISEAPVITADKRFYRAASDGGFARHIALLKPRR